MSVSELLKNESQRFYSEKGIKPVNIKMSEETFYYIMKENSSELKYVSYSSVHSIFGMKLIIDNKLRDCEFKFFGVNHG